MSSKSRAKLHPYITPDPRTRQARAAEAGDAGRTADPLRAADRAYRYVHLRTGDYQRSGVVAAAAEGLEMTGGLSILERARILTPRQVRRMKHKANARVARQRGATPNLVVVDETTGQANGR